MIPEDIMNIIIGVICLLFIIDNIVSFKIIFNLKEMTKEFKDNTDEISNKVKNIIRKRMVLYKRLVHSFPRLKENVFYSKWDEIKKKIEESKEEIRNKIDSSKEEIRGIINTSKKNYKKAEKKKEE